MKIQRGYNARYQSYLENGDYTPEHGLTHIPCPICTSRHCVHFDTDFLDIDFRDNTSQASDLRLYSSLIDNYDDEDTFRTTMYDTAIHVCGRECTPKNTKTPVRNIFNVSFKDVKAYQYYMGLHENGKKEYRQGVTSCMVFNFKGGLVCMIHQLAE